ncbi:AAA family ATPase [Streptomyces sp. NPDC004609]|uniref:AAA family ATPase n=1 Tax=Streptomyces sp. NPDC004609 TaxID=3364704 RepID=UPI0036D1FF85
MAAGFGEIEDGAVPEARELAGRLRRAAQDAGYTGVRELAAGTGVGRTTVSDAMTAKRVPTWPKLSALLRGCDVAPDLEWSRAHEAARQAVEREKRAARGIGAPTEQLAEHPADPPADQPDPASARPNTFSIRAPYGDLPPRVRGRDDLLARLETSLGEGESRAQILYGLGGCGKTTVALHLARQARDRGYRVFWLSASSADRLVTGMREVARELGADEGDIDAAWAGRTSATDLVWRWLDASERPWLLVVDNADEPAWLASDSGAPGDGTGWLRSSRAGMTVVTSRVGSPDVWGGEADTHRIGVLSPADGRDVLLDLAGDAGDPAEARVLAERLDGLPLALKLAGSYLARSARGAGLLRHRGRRTGRVRGFAAYTEALGEAGARFLDEGERRRQDDSDTEHMHRRLIGRTWELSLDLLEEQHLPEARSLMRLLSCCAPTPFPVELLDPEALTVTDHGTGHADATGTGSDAGTGPVTGAEPDQADRALEALIDLNLIDVVDIAPDGASSDQDAIPCLVSHRLVLEANALRLTDGPERERAAVWRAAARVIEAGAAVTAPELPPGWPWWRLLSPHVAAALTVCPDDEETLLPLLRAGLAAYAYYNFGNSYSETGKLARLLSRRSEVLDPDHPVRLSVRHRAALSLLQGRDELAEFEAVLAGQLARLGPDHPETLITRHNVAVSRQACGLTTESEKEAELRAVLSARRRVQGPHDPYTLLTHGALAQIIMSRGHGADEYRALVRHMESGIPEDRRLVPLHNRHHMAHALDSAERWTEAEAEYRSVLRDLEEYGERDSGLHRDLYHCLADNLRNQNRHQEALEAFDKSLAWFDGGDEDRSPDSHLALQIRHRRGDLLRSCGRVAEGEAEIRAIIELRLRTVDPGDSVVLSERHCLAHALEGLGRYAEAQDELRDVAASYASILGPGDKHTRESRYCLARILHVHGDRSEALGLYEQVLAAESAELGEDHSDTLVTRFRLDECRLDEGLLTPEAAREVFERVRERQVALVGEDHARVSVIVKALEDADARSRGV